MMQRHNILKWILAAWFMLLGCTASYGYTNYQTAPAYTNLYHTAVAPSYQFHTTSVYTSVVENPTFSPVAADPYSNSGPRKGMRKSSPWDEDDPETGGGNEVGVVDDTVPVGEPFVLLLLALLYGGYRLIKRKEDVI